MEKGLFRTSDGEVQVDYDGISIPIPRAKYEENGYPPAFDNLSSEVDYLAAEEKAKADGAAKRS